MKQFLALCLLVCSSALAVAEDFHFGIGVSAVILGVSSSETGSPDDKSSSSSFGSFVRIPLNENFETDIGLSVLLAEDNYSGGTASSTGMSVDGALYGTLVQAGPMALKSGVAASFGFESVKDAVDGNSSVSLSSLTVPLVFDFTVAERWGLRVSQPIALWSGTSEKKNGVTSTLNLTRINVSLGPAVSLYFMF